MAHISYAGANEGDTAEGVGGGTGSGKGEMEGLDFAHRTVFFRLGKHRVGQLPERYFFHPPPYISKRALSTHYALLSFTSYVRGTTWPSYRRVVRASRARGVSP